MGGTPVCLSRKQQWRPTVVEVMLMELQFLRRGGQCFSGRGVAFSIAKTQTLTEILKGCESLTPWRLHIDRGGSAGDRCSFTPSWSLALRTAFEALQCLPEYE